MMVDIFSSFDPNTSLFFCFSPLIFWIISFIFLTLISSSMWISPSFGFWPLFLAINPMNELSSQTSMLHLKGFPTLMSSLFIMLISLNLTGLIPYVFSLSGHLLLTLTLGLPLWLSLILSGASNKPKEFLAHLLPSGAPMWLNPLLILIETVSISVRFITLSFRLAANITAGHIVLGLMGVYSSSAIMTSNISFSLLISIQSMFSLFEMGVGLIQAYIFCLLLTLYSEDHPI